MATRTREANRFDAVINGVNYRLARQEGAYRKVSGRSQLEIQQMLNQAGNQFTSRRDLRTLFQTDWSGGAQWQKPLLSDQSIDTYNISEGFDLVTEPGNMFPTADVIEVSSSSKVLGRVPPIQVTDNEVYYVDNSGGNVGIVKWDGSSFTTLTNDFGTTQTPQKICWDSENDTIFGLCVTGEVYYVTPDSAGGAVDDIGSCTIGSNIFMHYGRLLAYDGSKLVEVSDPLGTPSYATIYDDGMGKDMLNGLGTASSDKWIGYDQATLAVASSEGVWIVKNVEQGGGATAFVTRVDRSSDGTNIGVPVATLPAGTVVLDVAYHLGSLLMTTAADPLAVYGNDISDYGFPKITIYHLTNDSLGTVGSPLGGLAPADAPYRFLGTRDSKIYLGGQDTIWVYDPVRGGLHQLVNNNWGASTGGSHAGMVATVNAGGDKVLQFSHFGETNVLQLPLEDEGGATDTHTLESNYIDGNLPSELKSLVGVTLMTSGIVANETWTVSIEADDGSFASVATFSNDGDKTVYKALATAVTGYRFRYKIAWTATGDVTSPSRVKGIVLHMVQGEMVTAWQLLLDGTEVRSVENKKLNPDDVLSDLETLMAKQTMTTFVDEFRKTSSTHDVRVDSVQITKDTPDELVATVVLTEQDLNN